MDLNGFLPVKVDDQVPIDDMVKLINDIKSIQAIWNDTEPVVTVKGPDGKLVRHQIKDYGSMSHREVLRYLAKPSPEAVQQFEDERQKRLARFKPLKQKWVEMDTCSKLLWGYAENGPNVHHVLGQAQDAKSHAFVDLYVRKLKDKEQIIIYLGVQNGPMTYLDTRDFLSSDIIDDSMSKEQCRRILEEFANSDFQMLFVSYDLRHEVNGSLGPTFFHNVRAVIIEELGNNPLDIEFKSFLEPCSVAYNSALPVVHVITIVRSRSASWMKDAIQSYIKAHELSGLAFHRHPVTLTRGEFVKALL